MLIEHVGSTAVPGLGGKNILDIMVGETPAHFQRRTNQLKSMGYVFHPENGSKDRLFFVRDTTHYGKTVRIHLHLTNLNDKEWKQKIAFRDYLRSDKAAMLKYAAIKRRAVRIAKGDKERYLKEKEGFINSITRKTVAGSRRRI